MALRTSPPDPNERDRLDQDLQFQTVYAPEFYPGRPEGRGRWCLLYAHGEPLGYLWTDDDEGLGFRASSDAGIQRTPEFARAFSAARKAGTPAAEVFDAWADRAGLGLSAGPVESGDLNTLPD